MSEFDLKACLNEIVAIQLSKANEMRIHLTAEVQMRFSNFTDATHRLMVTTDMKRFQQILVNLQSNALKFTRAGGAVTVIATLIPGRRSMPLIIGHHIERARPEKIQKMFERADEDKVVVEVRDTGVGISEESQQKLFKMFSSLKDHRQMNTNGVGLGLYISKNIVEQFGGSICVQSELGSGSSFFFSFNIEGAVVEETVVRRPISIRSGVASDFNNQRLDTQSLDLSLEQIDVRTLGVLQNADFRAQPRHPSNQIQRPNLKRIMVVDDEAFNVAVIKQLMRTLDPRIVQLIDSGFNGQDAVALMQ